MNAASICINAANETICCLLQPLEDVADLLDAADFMVSTVRNTMVGGNMIGQLLSEMHATHQMRWQCIKFLCKQWGWSRADAITACYFKGC